jgi:hypothetical protein
MDDARYSCATQSIQRAASIMLCDMAHAVRATGTGKKQRLSLTGGKIKAQALRRGALGL